MKYKTYLGIMYLLPFIICIFMICIGFINKNKQMIEIFICVGLIFSFIAGYGLSGLHEMKKYKTKKRIMEFNDGYQVGYNDCKRERERMLKEIDKRIDHYESYRPITDSDKMKGARQALEELKTKLKDGEKE